MAKYSIRGPENIGGPDKRPAIQIEDKKVRPEGYSIRGPEIWPDTQLEDQNIVTNTTVYNRSIYIYNLIDVYKYNLINAL